LLLYQLLAQSRDKKVFPLLLAQAAEWASQKMEAGATLLGLLVKYFPESAEKILTSVLL
jgi:hypothetical protein